MINIQWTPQLIITLALLIIMIILYFYFSSRTHRLDSIKSKVVGDGQKGTDRWMTEKEKDTLFEKVIIPSEITDMSDQWKPGRLVDYNEKTRTGLIDPSMTHASLEAPTEIGKTSRYWMTNVQYNMMAGTNMILPSIKKEIIDLTIEDAKKLGYNTYVIDFENPKDSIGIDFFEDINFYMKKFMESGDLEAGALAETFAGKLADDIVTSRSKGDNSNSNPFFIGASKGVLHSTFLMISMFSKDEEKHFGSARSYIQNVLSMPAGSATNGKAKEPKIIKLLRGMPDNFGPKKHIGAAFAASSETEDNIYSSVLDDLQPMNDTMAEQIISLPGQKEIFDYRKLINEKTILYIHCPESRPEFFIFFKLVIKKLCNQLSAAAKKMPNERLPRQIRISWDEFGISPAIQAMDTEMAIDRGMGVLFDLIYQDNAQILEKYGENNTQTIKNQCGMRIVLGCAPSDTKGAEEVSKMTGTQTIKTGSISRSNDGSGHSNNSITESMDDRALMTPGEIMRLEKTGQHLVFKRGEYPMIGRYTAYYLPEWGLTPTPYSPPLNQNTFKNVQFADFQQIQIKLDKYREAHGLPATHSTMKISYFDQEEMNLNNTIPHDDIEKELMKHSKNDKDVLAAFKKGEYMDVLKQMKKYTSISRYELETLLSEIN